MSSSSSPNDRVQAVLHSPAAERIGRDAARASAAAKRGATRFQSVAGPIARKSARWTGERSVRAGQWTVGSSRHLGAQVAADARQAREWAAQRQRPHIRARWLVAVAASVAAVALGVVAVNTFTRDEPAPVAAPAEVGTPLVIENVSDGRQGRVFALAAGVPLFPLPAGSLSASADAPIEMQDAAVLSVVPEVGFWVGSDMEQRIFVRMQMAGDADASERMALPELQTGQIVNLSGYLRLNSASAQTVGLSDPADAALFDRLNYTVEANSVRPQ